MHDYIFRMPEALCFEGQCFSHMNIMLQIHVSLMTVTRLRSTAYDAWDDVDSVEKLEFSKI